MAEPLIDLKALLVEHEDCDAGTVQKLRNGLAQGGPQFKALREAADAIRKKLEAGTGNAKKLHLKLGIAYYFLGYMESAADSLEHAETALGAFYLGRALVARQKYDEALAAFDKAEKAGYTASTVQLQKTGVLTKQGKTADAKALLATHKGLESHSAEYHFQAAGLSAAGGDHPARIKSLERAVELDPTHTAALFQLGYANDLAGNDDDAIGYYERCLKHPPVHIGAVNNLGILYEDNEKYDKAADCYGRMLRADYNDERARLYLKDAQASQTMYYNPDDDAAMGGRFGQVLELPVTDFELSVRSRNCLKKMNIRTLGDLTRVTEQQLLASKNFGDTSLDEINDIMKSKGLRLGQSLEQGEQYANRFRPQQQLSPEEQATLNRPVSELNLSVRARKCMSRLGITTLGELCQRTADELLEAKNFGVTSLTEVREKLTAYGLKLRSD